MSVALVPTHITGHSIVGDQIIVLTVWNMITIILLLLFIRKASIPENNESEIIGVVIYNL